MEPQIQIIQTCRGVWYTQGDGFFFRKKDGRGPNTIKLKCIENGCTARASVRRNENGQAIAPLRIGHNWEHAHDPDPDRSKEEEMRCALLNASEKTKSKLKRTYDEVTKDYNSTIVARRQYVSVCSGMAKKRKKNTPNVPDNLPNLYFSVLAHKPDLLKTQDGNDFTVHCNEENLMLISPGTAPLLENEDTIFCMDGTFKCTPKKPKVQQFYVLGGMMGKTFIAIAYILMERKSKEAYKWIFDNIREFCPAWNPQHFLTDFESGALAAVRDYFPGARHQGCWFHCSQAIEKKAKELGLNPLVKELPAAKAIVQRLMVLALLPGDQIQAGYNAIMEFKNNHELNVIRHDVKLNNLMNYVQQYWINQIGPGRMSAADSHVRTNNSLEAFNKHILLHTNGPHPDCWTFLESIKTTERQMTIKYHGANAGRPTNFPLAKKWRLHHARIENACMLLQIGAYNVGQFIARVSHSRNFKILEINEANAMQDDAGLAGQHQDGEAEEDVDDPQEI